MPTYGTASNVEALLPSITLDAAGHPTTAQVEGYIDIYEAQLHTVLRHKGYAVPLTNSSDTTLAGGMVERRAAFDTFFAMYEVEIMPANIAAFKEMWLQFLKDIKNGDIEFATDTPDGEDDATFLIIRQPTRDKYFTNRYGVTDWDE